MQDIGVKCPYLPIAGIGRRGREGVSIRCWCSCWPRRPGISGHHSFAAHYFEEQSVTIQGTLVEFAYEAPHAWVHLSVTDDGGAVRRSAAEWANPNRLSRDGITKETLKAGDCG